jgi:pyruvate/2-oxoglutarate/acetoin dehydrogenase E1 component
MSTREVSYREAIRDGLAEEMERDPAVFVMGEDVEPGGVFNVTPGLLERFGESRVIDTPISELAFTGAAFGAAVKGLRPVVEIMFGDFLGLVIDTLVNQSSKYWYLSNGQGDVPLVVRSAVGGGARFGACHSQTPVGWFLGEPGLKLVCPATPADAKGLTKSAIRDDNPVIVFEHKLLYGRKSDVPDGEEALVPIGKAAVRRAGSDVTVAAAMRAVETAMEAAEQLAGEGIQAEVIDLRSLRPLDAETIGASAARTKRLVVVEEAAPTGGYAAEVVAAAVELAGSIAARRVTMPDTPMPFAGPLEDAALPQAGDVVAAARALAA